MARMKPHKGVLKRVRVTATGQIKHRKANASHLMSGKRAKRRRRLRRPEILQPNLARRIKAALAGAER